MDDNIFDITIRICGRPFKLSIPRAEEEIYRNAAKLLNQRIEHYKGKFEVPHEDIMSMVSLEFAVEYEKLLNQYHQAPISEMNKISEMLSKELDDEETTEDGALGND